MDHLHHIIFLNVVQEHFVILIKTYVHLCPPGYNYISNPNIGVSNIELWGCNKCSIGKFSSTIGSSKCDSCPISTYSDIPGLSSCKKCSIDTYSDQIQQSTC